MIKEVFGYKVDSNGFVYKKNRKGKLVGKINKDWKEVILPL